jgi:branched-chain amino acid transport system permease protein
VQKLGVFAVSGLLIGIAGCLSAFVNGTPPPTVAFNVIWSVIFLAIPIASGLRDISSVWLVAAGFTALPIILESHHINPNLLSGLILLGALLASQSRNSLARLRRKLMPEKATAPVAVSAKAVRVAARPPATAPSDVLVGSGISVTFGGIKAVQGVSVRVAPGQRVGIVGANGAGKTTLFNAITGFIPDVEGEVKLGERDLTGMPAYQRARAGLRRSFQLPRLADVLTVWQNVVLGQGAPNRDVEERAEWLLARLGMLPLKDTPIDAVPFGVRREVEIIRALVQEPEVLLLDEPVSGLEDHEMDRLLEVLLDLQRTEGWGLLVIEHDLRFITGIAEYLMVMEAGQVLTEGPVQNVLADERVKRVYLGEVVAV